MIKIISLRTVELNKYLTGEILKLKDTHWKKGLQSQRKFFKKNILDKDTHILLFYGKKLSGYVLLRDRKCLYKKKTISYLLFDTLIIKENLRNKKLSSILMNFTNNIIKFKNKRSILFCNRDVIKYYKKFEWKKVSCANLKLNIKKPLKKSILIYN